MVTYTTSCLLITCADTSQNMTLAHLTAGRVVLSQTEEVEFASIAALTLHIFFTDALTAQTVTQTSSLRTGWVTVTWYAAMRVFCCSLWISIQKRSTSFTLRPGPIIAAVLTHTTT